MGRRNIDLQSSRTGPFFETGSTGKVTKKAPAAPELFVIAACTSCMAALAISSSSTGGHAARGFTTI
jgi:hypothetical protein